MDQRPVEKPEPAEGAQGSPHGAVPAGETPAVSRDAPGGGWIRTSGPQRPLFLAALVSAALMVLGGFGPWARWGPISAAGTDGDGWFLIVAGAVSGGLLLRWNARSGRGDLLGWLIPVGGAVGAFVALIDLVDVIKTDLITPGWGIWIGAIAGLALTSLGVRLQRSGRTGLVAAVLATALVAGAGIGVGLAIADENDEPAVEAEVEEEDSEALFPAEEPEPEIPPPAIEAAEGGMTDQEGLVSYGAILENTSSEHAALDITVTINLVGEGGTVISTETAHVEVIRAGESFGVGGTTSVEGAQVSRLEVEATARAGSEESVQLPTVRDPQIIDGEFGRSARAEITNPLEETISSIADIFFVFRDADGEIVGGDLTFPDTEIRPGRRVAVEATIVPDRAQEAEVYPDAETTG